MQRTLGIESLAGHRDFRALSAIPGIVVDLRYATPGTVVPPNSVVGGVPAKVLRPATDDDMQHIRGNAASYTDRLALEPADP